MCKNDESGEQGHDHGETNSETKTSCEPAEMIDNYQKYKEEQQC